MMRTSIEGISRRSLMAGILTAGVAPLVVPARVLGMGAAIAPSNRMTLGVIGVGGQGVVDMRAFLNHEDVQVMAICDVNQKRIQAAQYHLKEAYGKADAKVFTDFRELNRDASIDAVVMALPVHWHSIPAMDAVLQGKHLYHEKPVAISVAEAVQIRSAVKKKGVVFQLGTQQRSDLKFRWASELARNGRLGKLKEIQVAVSGGIRSETFAEQPLPDYVDWDRWVGPAPMTTYHASKLSRSFHENISNFSLGMISCWGIHHLDIAQWGNGTDGTGPVTVEGEGVFPEAGSCDTVLSWTLRYEFAEAAPVVFKSEGQDFQHGVRFIGERGWVHVLRGKITASDEGILRDPENRPGTMPVKLMASVEHTRNFVDAVKNGTATICDVDTAVRSDTLCQLAAIALKARRKLVWDPNLERFNESDTEANALLHARPFRGEWKLPEMSAEG